jgi:hypothetical protein
VQNGPDGLYEPLLNAARAGDTSQVSAALLLIHMLDGDAGFRTALVHLADAATAHVPKPAPGAHYHCHAVAFSRDENGHVGGEQEIPYELRWALGMMTARVNNHQSQWDDLIEAAIDTRKLAACSLALATLAGRADDINTVIM